MASEVFFTDMRTGTGDSIPDKLLRLVEKAGIGRMDCDRKFVAIKMHFGELGNLAYLRPGIPRVLAEKTRELGGIPFLTDCNTLYVGRRKSAPEHLDTANYNGFNRMSAGCQIIIADGLKGTDDVEVPINGEYVETAKIGRAIYDADVIVTVTHFKCHELTGYGGALKNLAMGCASRRGKMEMHSAGKPSVDRDKCVGCGTCARQCAESAIALTRRKAAIDKEKCVGCGRCIGSCLYDAITAENDQDAGVLNAKIVEYAMAAIKGKPNFHVTVMTDISPNCDCHAENDVPVIPDVGMLASFDPVALDRACIDIAMRQTPIEGSELYEKCAGEIPEDMFACIHPTTRWQSTFEHADKMGFGSSDYVIVNIK
ncbi:MAG: DUF362 domain-containing protein [Methanomassiliicoccaceae archaeon]|nr:DUF362 domain-containing protein [Methanomassiliicoccaceae archaeon]